MRPPVIDRRDRPIWDLLTAKLLIMVLIALTQIVEGLGEAQARLSGLLAMDWRIVRRWRREDNE